MHWLIESLFAYDVVGFQTASDVTNFQRYVLEQAGGVLKAGGQIIGLRPHRRRARLSRSASTSTPSTTWRTRRRPTRSIQLLAQRTLNRAQIIGVDRLDYTKGLPDRFRAFRRLLELYPEQHQARHR